MLIALPNPDKSFTLTLFAPQEQFNALEGEGMTDAEKDAKVKPFFEKHFPDAVRLIPDLLTDFKNNPTGKLNVCSRPFGVH